MTARMSILSCALAAFAAFAESVPQTSADKYYFTVPKHPGGIKGVVMGDPPAYRVMRSEDIDWINEAYAERNALRSGTILSFPSNTVAEFGKWPLYSTNGLIGWTTSISRENADEPVITNIVAKYTLSDDIPNTLLLIGNPPRGSLVPWTSDSEKNSYRSVEENVLLDEGLPAVYLDPDQSKWSSVSSYSTNYYDIDFPQVTEFATTTTTNWTGRYLEHGEWRDSVRTNISYITMTMTNGTASVHTNMWIEILPHVETTLKTNIIHKSKLGMMFKSGLIELYDPQNPESDGGPFRTSAVTANYGPLRGAIVIAATCRNLTTNELTQTIRDWYEHIPSNPNDYDNTTNDIHKTMGWPTKEVTAKSTTTKSFFVDMEYDPETDEWYEVGTHIETESLNEGSIIDEAHGGVTCRLMTWLPTDTVHAGGVDSRIDSVDVYVWADANWSRTWEVEDETGGEYKSSILCKNVGAASEDGSVESVADGVTNKYECFSATIPASILDDAMAATGNSFPQVRPSVQLEKVCPEPDRDNYVTRSEAEESWFAHITMIILVVHFSPWTSLSGW